MADSSSYRSSRAGALPPRRDESSTDPARDAVSDPLAELARLIGQDEAFGAIVRNSGRPEPRGEPPRRQAEEPPPWRARPSEPASQWDRDDPQSHAAQGTANALSRYLDSRRSVDPQAHPASHDHDAPEPAAPAHDAPAYDPHAQETEAAHGDVAYAAAGHAHPDDAAQPPHDPHAAGEYYEDAETHDGEDEYADAEPERRRGGLVIVAAVIGLALVGTAGAFGYWAWTGGSAGHGEPPLIKADTAPNKVVPATQAESPGNKRTYDRIGGEKGGAAEQVVPREEAPTEIKPAGAPRQIYPTPGGVYGPPPVASPAAAPPPAATGVPASGETRKVRTETIRPGQVAAIDPGPSAAPPPPAAAAPAPVPAAPAKQGARPKQGAPQALAAPAAEAPPARAAAPAGGGYVVQLSSQRSEDEAMASFKALQTKYAAVFGDRQPLIRRADLGDKGVFYRAQVGPFPTHDQANQFCSNLKIAGGQCIVQKN